MARPMKAPRPWGAEMPSFFAIALPPRHSGPSTRRSAYPSTHAVANWPPPSFMIGAGLRGIVPPCRARADGRDSNGHRSKDACEGTRGGFRPLSIAPFRRRAGQRARNPARASDALRQKDLDRDGEGRYFIKFE